MKTVKVDVAIIGAGTAGLTAYKAATKAGARTILIEQGPHGTPGARVGCMPSKFLIAAADAAQAARLAPEFGGLAANVRITGHEVRRRARAVPDRCPPVALPAVHDRLARPRLPGKAR